MTAAFGLDAGVRGAGRLRVRLGARDPAARRRGRPSPPPPRSTRTRAFRGLCSPTPVSRAGPRDARLSGLARAPGPPPTMSRILMRWRCRSPSAALLAGEPALLAVALIWVAHIGLDRALGYGLKYPSASGDTHPGRVGRR